MNFEIKNLSENSLSMEFPEPLKKSVTIAFTFSLLEDYKNGDRAKQKCVTLFEIPGLGRYDIKARSHAYKGDSDIVEEVFIGWEWNEDYNSNQKVVALVPEINGGEEFHFLLTVDAQNNMFSVYINGIHHLLPDLREYDLAGMSIEKLIFNAQEAKFSNFEAWEDYTPAQSVQQRVPEKYYRSGCRFLGNLSDCAVMDYEGKKGALVYHCPLSSAEDMKDWVVDSGIMSYENDCLRMRSEFPDDPDVHTGHVTVWCDKEFPENFIMQTEFKIITSDLCIVFFSAHGVNGRDMLGADMPVRRGEFFHYIKEQILSYHISYHAKGRGRSNLRKNNKFYLMATGDSGAEERDVFHKLTLIKDKNHMQCFVNDTLIIDSVDNDERRYGACHTGGKIGLRQMKKAVGEYKNFTVWELK